jgi:alkanesulfonate monooxygenase SsuD/methylene tetrahydromethanopterin reductase-like flavin-dependent oxidoreductase (luciferase family)
LPDATRGFAVLRGGVADAAAAEAEQRGYQTAWSPEFYTVDPSGPASRMEELIPLLRQLWRLHEGPVKHDGRFYHVDITPTAEMAPPLRTGIPVFTAGVNRRMIEVAAQLGFHAAPRTYGTVVEGAAPHE